MDRAYSNRRREALTALLFPLWYVLLDKEQIPYVSRAFYKALLHKLSHLSLYLKQEKQMFSCFLR